MSDRGPGPTAARQSPQVSFAPPCDEPPGGWTIRNSGTATESHYLEGIQYARVQAEYAGAWIGWLLPVPSTPMEMDQVRYSVLVAAFKGEVQHHRARIEEIYGGPVCVIERPKTEAELQLIGPEALAFLAERGVRIRGSYLDIVTFAFRVDLVSAPPRLVEELDARFGKGFVIVTEVGPGSEGPPLGS